MAEMKADKPKAVRPKKPKVNKPKDDEGLDTRPPVDDSGKSGDESGKSGDDSNGRYGDRPYGEGASGERPYDEDKPDAHILTGRRGLDNKIRMRLLRGRGYLPTGSVVYATLEEADAMEADGTARRIDEHAD